MANELTLSASLKFTKGDLKVSYARTGLRVNVNGTKTEDSVQEIGTSRELISLGEAGAGGYVFLQNLGTAAGQTISISDADDTSYIIELLAGDIALFRLKDAAIYAIATSVASNLRVLVIPL